MITVSPSLIGMLMECPRCLWLHFREDLRRPSGPFPSLPGGMDSVIKVYFDEYRKSGELPPELASLKGEKLFDDIEQLKEWRNNRRGLKKEFPELDIALKGAIDELLVNEGGEFVVFDFKTRGWPTKEDSHVYYQSQLNLYALLFESFGHKAAPYGYLLFFWPQKYSKEDVKFKTELRKIPVSAKEGIKLLEGVAAIVRGEKPDPHPNCDFCRYRNQGAD